ncbi:MAG: ABC transporter permease [Bacteroidetes bacterium]|nr:ABC transporter permease [Bacteroidota bacterium]
MGATDINWLNLGITYLLLSIPLLVLWYYETGLVGKVLIATLRMSAQLFLVGFYLLYLIEYNNIFINLGWVLVMIVVAAITTINRSQLKRKYFVLPVITGLIVAVAFTDSFLLGITIKMDGGISAQYLIPITGMIIGNCMERNILVLGNYYSRIREHQQQYRFSVANGATRREALAPFIRDSIKKAFNPYIAMMMTIGIISLPGMMTGQILEGGSAFVAVKYQIMIVIAIFIASMITVMLSIFLANRITFDEYDNIREEVIGND